jgi:ribonuclease P protein component
VKLAPAKRPLGFPKEFRLRRRKDFVWVQSGSKISGDFLLGLYRPQVDVCPLRIGFTVSSKVGNAVVRNRIRRTLREAFRKNRTDLPKGLDVVIVARPNAAKASGSQLTQSLVKVLARLPRESSTKLARQGPA